MIGAVIIIVVLVLLMPFSFFMLGGIVSAALGWALKTSAEDTHPGSELIDLNT